MWNSSIRLPTEKITNQDSEGFTKESWEFTEEIPARFLDTTRMDETLANQCGYQADLVAEIMACNYNGASFFIDAATESRYEIKRTFRLENSGKVQLTGERREHGKI